MSYLNSSRLFFAGGFLDTIGPRLINHLLHAMFKYLQKTLGSFLIVLNIFLSFAVFFSLHIPLAAAVMPTGSMTGASQTINVGLITAINQITVLDNNTPQITAANNIRIRIPAGVNATWDTNDLTTNAYGGMGASKASTTVSYPDTKTLLIDVTEDFGAMNALIITGLSFIGTAQNNAVGLTWSIDGGTDYATGTPILQVIAPNAQASMALSTNSVVGVAGNSTLTLTPAAALANNDSVQFTAPPVLDVSAVAFVSETFGGAGTFTGCSAAGQTVTCTSNGVINGNNPGNIVMSGIKALYVGNGPGHELTNVTVRDFDATSGANASTTFSNIAPLTNTTVGNLSPVFDVVPTALTTSTVTTITVTFTTNATIPNLGAVVVSLPDGFVTPSINTVAGNLSGLNGTWTVDAAVGQAFRVIQTGGTATAAGAKSFTVAGITTGCAPGATGPYQILTRNTDAGGAQDIEQAFTGGNTLTGANLCPVVGVSHSATFNDITNVAVTDYEGGGVLLTWEDPTSDNTSTIQILRGVDPLPVDGTVYDRVAKGVEQYIDEDVEEGDVVSYILRPANSSSTGDQTTVVTFTVGSGLTSEAEDTSSATTTTDTTSDTSGTESAAGEEESTIEETEVVVEETGAVFSDIAGHWGEAAITWGVENGVMEGYEDGTCLPDANLNRSEAAALLWRVLGLGEPTAVIEDPFMDVPFSGWDAPYIGGLKGLGLVEGNPDGSYEPFEEINRAEFTQLAVNVYLYLYPDMDAEAAILMAGTVTDRYVDLDTAAWYAPVVTVATEWEFVQGSACEGGVCFNAENTITRAEATTILYNMLAEEVL